MLEQQDATLVLVWMGKLGEFNKRLEYFCAWEFVGRFEKERSITLDDLKTEVFGKHCQDESWHEVLRLIAGMLDAKFVGEIIEYLI